MLRFIYFSTIFLRIYFHVPNIQRPLCLPHPPFGLYFSGAIIISECSLDRSIVRRVGTQVLLAANSLLHLCAHSTDEDQPMVRAKY